MPETVPEAWLLAAALLSANTGMGWLALTMPVHWRQICGDAPRSQLTVSVLRALSLISLLLSLTLCLLADVATMAVLVWMMAMAVSAVWVALLLSWRPRLLAPLALR